MRRGTMIAVGVDTHKHEHLARALDHLGQLLGGLTVDASLAGYRHLVQWHETLGEDVLVGIEGAGSQQGAPTSVRHCGKPSSADRCATT
jgi:transposase